MRLVIQRVLESSVKVEGREVGRIGKGFMVLCGVEDGDTAEDVRYCVDKTVNLRVFEDENDKMNRSILDAGGEILAVSQFTLHGDVRHGRRPSFIRAARPELAVPMYDAYCQGLRNAGIHVETGIFQTDMKVSLINDGPVTLLIDSRRHSDGLDIKTVTGGPLDVNTYVVGADGSNQCVLIDPGRSMRRFAARSAAGRSRRCC